MSRNEVLVSLAAAIRAEVELAEADFASAVQHGIRAGELLIEAKSQVKHGEWLPWLGANFPGSERSAQNYMRLAANAQRVAHLPSLRAALEALSESRPEKHAALLAAYGLPADLLSMSEDEMRTLPSSVLWAIESGVERLLGDVRRAGGTRRP